MGLIPDTPIVTEAQVSAVTHESLLTNQDQGLGTLSALLSEATNALIRAVKQRGGIDPALITNTPDLRAAAAYWVMWRLYSSQPQGSDEIRAKTELYERAWAKEISSVVLEQGNAQDDVLATKGLPRAINIDSVPYVSNGVDNRKPTSLTGSVDTLGPFYTTR